MSNKIIAIVGPTASGKTNTSIKLAKIFKGEIVSFDSMQVYKGMPILTQTPLKAQMQGVKHYLINKISPSKEFSAAMFISEAEKIIKKIFKDKRQPILVGGTGLYLKALVDGLFPAPGRDEKLRGKLEKKAAELGPGALHDELKALDKDASLKIHPNDTRRIIRALEIYYLTGVPMTEHKKNTKGLKDLYEIEVLGIDMDRAELYKRIDARVEKMFEDGIVDEVKKVLKKKLSLTAKSALGINEIKGYLSGEYGIEEAKGLLKKNTRNYAKRQMTWFRADKKIRWFTSGEGIISYCRADI